MFEGAGRGQGRVESCDVGVERERMGADVSGRERGNTLMPCMCAWIWVGGLRSLRLIVWS